MKRKKKALYELLINDKLEYYIHEKEDHKALESVIDLINSDGNLGEYTLISRKKGDYKIIAIFEG